MTGCQGLACPSSVCKERVCMTNIAAFFVLCALAWEHVPLFKKDTGENSTPQRVSCHKGRCTHREKEESLSVSLK